VKEIMESDFRKSANKPRGVGVVGTFPSNYEWWIIGVSAVTATLLGYVGFSGKGYAFLDALYRALSLFTLQSGAIDGEVPVSLEIARWLAPVVLAYAAVKTLFVVARDQMKLLRLGSFRDHVVVCGLGQKGVRLMNGFIELGQKVVAIEVDRDSCAGSVYKDRRAIVLAGNAADESMLRRARVQYAKYLIVVTGKDDTNVEIAIKAFQLLKSGSRLGRKGKLFCFVHIFDLKLQSLFKRHEVFTSTYDSFDARVFNIYEKSARIILDNFAPDHFVKVRKRTDPALHILIVGFGWTGESLAVQAARVGHYANGKKLKVTVLDLATEAKAERFYHDYPYVDQILDLRFVTANAETLGSQSLDGLQKGASPAAVYVCLGDEGLNLSTATRLRRVFPKPPIVVCMPQKTGISTLLRGSSILPNESNIHIFNMIERACDVPAVVDEIMDRKARAIHEHYVEQEAKRGAAVQQNPFLVAWEQLPEDAKDSSRHQADHIPVKLRAVGCKATDREDQIASYDFSSDPDAMETMAKMEHRRWVAERLLSGWTYGKTKDIVRRTHPDLVPWEKLSIEVRNKDKNAVESVPEAMARVGLKIVPESVAPAV
jgi:hypothetical protein